MIKMDNVILPEKKWIDKNKIDIFSILFFYFVIIVNILLLKCFKLTTYSKSIIYITMVNQILTFYSCFINWNDKLLMYNHYLFVVLLYITLLSNDIVLVSYFYSAVLITLLIWNTKEKCIFDTLSWDIKLFGQNTDQGKQFRDNMMYILALVYTITVAYMYR